ncbi:MAG: two-component sensor histidine kinase [Phycisphaerae bacterium]|nr:two-component sensor histidine kinase [Phycisphaerae bacterium]
MCKGFFRTVRSSLHAAGAAVAAKVSRPGRGQGAASEKAADHTEELTRLTGELAHEIKNPLSTIKVNLKLAEEALRDVDLSDPGRVLWDSCRRNLTGAAHKIGIVQKETDRLEQILEGFLKYVRRPDLQLETVDLNELVGDMIDFYSPQAYSYSLTVRQSLINEPLVCRVDAGALKQVLLNLFINAQQAMSPGGELMIHTSRQRKLAVVVVNDTGRGIAPERVATLFQPYQSSRSGGMGLGLATAKKIIEAHEGRIQVHSELGKGTSFTISLPLAQVDGSSTE